MSERRYLSVSGVFEYVSPLFSNSPSDTHASSKRGNSLQSCGRLPSKIPSSTAANIVLERRNASIRSRTVLEVVIALGLEWFACVRKCAGLSLSNSTDPNSRNANTGRDSVEQFVVFAVVQRLFNGRAFEERDVIEVGRHSGSQRQAMQIERQAIADVHACGGFTQ